VKPGSAAAVVVSASFWQSHFGGNSGVLGQTVRMFDKNLAIMGVLPPGFHFPDKTDVWLPANTIFGEGDERKRTQLPGRGQAETRREPGASASADEGHRHATGGAISG